MQKKKAFAPLQVSSVLAFSIIIIASSYSKT